MPFTELVPPLLTSVFDVPTGQMVWSSLQMSIRPLLSCATFHDMLHSHYTSPYTPINRQWILMGGGETCLAHKNKITLQASSWDQDSIVVSTAYQLSVTTVCTWLLHISTTTSATSNHKKSAWLTQKLQGREPYLLNMPHTKSNVNLLIKYYIVKITFQRALSKYFSL